MALKIKASSLFTARYLKVTDTGVVFQETAALGGKRRFNFSEIAYVLMSPSSELSFQVGNEIFSIPVKAKHQPVIAALLDGVRRHGAGGFPVQPLQ